jgi:hypothetical protein
LMFHAQTYPFQLLFQQSLHHLVFLEPRLKVDTRAQVSRNQTELTRRTSIKHFEGDLPRAEWKLVLYQNSANDSH